MAVGALEVGGSHLSVAVAERGSPELRGYARLPLDSTGSLAAFLVAVEEAVRGLPEVPDRWAVAIPSPFDYVTGRGGLHPAGKFSGLAGVDLRAALVPLLGAREIVFLNDAAAFGLGCAQDHPGPLLALTFGSGIGSAFVAEGQPVLDDRVPPGGEVYCLPVAPGSPVSLEDRFGPAALASAHGFGSFRELSAYAAQDADTADAIRAAFAGLADALAPWLRSFQPATIVCGGGVCHAWDLFGAAFTTRLIHHLDMPLRVNAVTDTEPVALRGAAAALDPVGLSPVE